MNLFFLLRPILHDCVPSLFLYMHNPPGLGQDVCLKACVILQTFFGLPPPRLICDVGNLVGNLCCMIHPLDDRRIQEAKLNFSNEISHLMV